MSNHIADSTSRLHALAMANLNPDETMVSGREFEALLGVGLIEQSSRRAQKLVVCETTRIIGKRGLHTVYPASFVHSLQAFLSQRASTWEVWLLHLIHYTRSTINESDYQLLKRLCQELVQAGKLMRAIEARHALGLSESHFKSWVKREFLAMARLSKSTVYFASSHIREQARILALKNIKEAAEYLGVNPEDMRLYANHGRVACVPDAAGHKHFTDEALTAFKKRLDKSHYMRSYEAADRLGVTRAKTIVKYHHQGLLQGVWAQERVLFFSESEIKRAEQELSEYVICAGFEWLEAFMTASKLEAKHLTAKQVARMYGNRSVKTLSEWKRVGIIPFYIQKFFVGYPYPPAIFYPKVYFQRLKTFLGKRPLSRDLAIEFRDMCAERGRLPLA